MQKACVRCGKPVEPGRRKYCSDACSDSSLRERIKAGKARGLVIAKRTYRYYPKRG
jgi:predicted nucleic acid-binding Zn ribbon protein